MATFLGITTARAVVPAFDGTKPPWASRPPFGLCVGWDYAPNAPDPLATLLGFDIYEPMSDPFAAMKVSSNGVAVGFDYDFFGFGLSSAGKWAGYVEERVCARASRSIIILFNPRVPEWAWSDHIYTWELVDDSTKGILMTMRWMPELPMTPLEALAHADE